MLAVARLGITGKGQQITGVNTDATQGGVSPSGHEFDEPSPGCRDAT